MSDVARGLCKVVEILSTSHRDQCACGETLPDWPVAFVIGRLESPLYSTQCRRCFANAAKVFESPEKEEEKCE